MWHVNVINYLQNKAVQVQQNLSLATYALFMYMSKTNIMTRNILFLLLIRKPHNESLLLSYGTKVHHDGSKYWIGGFPSVKKSN